MKAKCPKCGAVFEYSLKAGLFTFRAGPYRWLKCPVCKKRSMINVWARVEGPEKIEKEAQPTLTKEERLERQLEESKYEEVEEEPEERESSDE